MEKRLVAHFIVLKRILQTFIWNYFQKEQKYDDTKTKYDLTNY